MDATSICRKRSTQLDGGQLSVVWHVPSSIISCIMNVIRGHVVRIRVDGELTESIELSQGVLQGDTLAPFVFILVLDSILRGLPSRDCC